jgi:hypothetical protein
MNSLCNLPKFTSLLAAVSSLLLNAFPVSADVDKTIFQKCDRNGDGRLDDQEFYVYSLHTGKAGAYWEAVDPNYSGKIDPAARAKFERESELAARQQVERERVVAGEERRDRIRIEELYPSGESAATNLRKQLYGFQIARTYDQITADPAVLNDTEAANKAFEAAQPAILSYKYDFVNDKDTWQASGVIAYPIQLATEFWITPSIAFDRVSTNDSGTAEEDSLIFRLQYERTVPDFAFTRSTTFRGNILFNTNSELEQKVLGGELDIQPTTGIWGDERFDYHVPGLKWKWQAFLHLEAGGNLNEGDSANSTHDFVRLGPKTNVTVYILFNPGDLGAEINNRVALSLDYNYFVALDSALDAWLLRAQIITYLDHNHHFSLNGEYSNGYAPLENTRAETFLVTLGVKF